MACHTYLGIIFGDELERDTLSARYGTNAFEIANWQFHTSLADHPSVCTVSVMTSEIASKTITSIMINTIWSEALNFFRTKSREFN